VSLGVSSGVHCFARLALGVLLSVGVTASMSCGGSTGAGTDAGGTDHPPEDTGVDHPLEDTGVDHPPEDSGGAVSDAPAPAPDTGGTADAPIGPADAGSTDTRSDAPTGTIPMFVAVGGGRFRRLISCDDGLTWIGDQMDTSSDPDEAVGARGLAYGNGLFVAATGGGGRTGRVFATADGVLWSEVVPTGTYNGFSQTAYGSGYYVAGGGNVSIRSARGTTGWGEQASMGDGGILRQLTFGGGKFVAVGGGRIQHSADALTWAAQTSGSCAGDPIGVVFGNGRFLAVTTTGGTCLSADGGVNWTNGSIGGTDPRAMIWTGHDFLVRGGSRVYRSDDGSTWTSTASTGAGPDVIALSDRGTFAGVAGTTFYRSTDGISWTRATAPAGTQSLTRMVFGYGSASSLCPGP
jgi:hypothetical protein